MTDLASWLLEQIEDDEAAARIAGPGEWQRDGINSVWDSDGRLVVYGDGPAPAGAQADHIARHDPARVLAECAALRRIVQQHGVKRTDSYDGEQFCDECGTGRRDWGPGAAADFYPTDWPCLTLRLLAQPFAGRPGFDPAWKVET